MRGIALTIALVFLAVAAPQVEAQSSETAPLQGVWEVFEREVQGGPNEGVYPVQPSFLMYTDRHFAWVLDFAQEPRMPVDSPSDAEIVASIQPTSTAAGTYEFDGETIEYWRIASVNPASINQPLIRRVNKLTKAHLETTWTTDDGARVILKYRRVE